MRPRTYHGRKYKGAIIERVEHPKTKRTGVVRLDKGGMWFFARENDTDLLTEPFASKDGGEVRDWLLKQLAHTTAEDRLEWLPAVEIEYGSGGTDHHSYRDETEKHTAGFDLTIRRYWIALTRDQREWRDLRWDQCDEESPTCVPENERYAQSDKYGKGPKAELVYGDKPFSFPCFKGRGDKVVLPYTPELWHGLLLVVEQLRQAEKSLQEMVSTKHGVAGLTEIGAGKVMLLLTPSTKKGNSEDKTPRGNP